MYLFTYAIASLTFVYLSVRMSARQRAICMVELSTMAEWGELSGPHPEERTTNLGVILSGEIGASGSVWDSSTIVILYPRSLSGSRRNQHCSIWHALGGAYRCFFIFRWLLQFLVHLLTRSRQHVEYLFGYLFVWLIDLRFTSAFSLSAKWKMNVLKWIYVSRCYKFWNQCCPFSGTLFWILTGKRSLAWATCRPTGLWLIVLLTISSSGCVVWLIWFVFLPGIDHYSKECVWHLCILSFPLVSLFLYFVFCSLIFLFYF